MPPLANYSTPPPNPKHKYPSTNMTKRKGLHNHSNQHDEEYVVHVWPPKPFSKEASWVGEAAIAISIGGLN
jgi:hypothetical protein